MTPSRLLSLSALAMLGLLGCREDRVASLPGAAAPGISSLVARTVFLVDETRFDSMLVTTSQDSVCIRRDSSRTVCRTETGDSALFRSWRIPPGPQSDGDMEQFIVRGRFSANPRLRVLELRLGHDAPFLLLWDPWTGRLADFSFNYDSVWVSTSRKTILLVPHNTDTTSRDPLRLLTDIDGTPGGWRCGIPLDSLRIDSAVLVRSGDSVYVHPDSLPRTPALRCQPDTTVWSKMLPDWVSQTAEPVVTPVLKPDSGRTIQP